MRRLFAIAFACLALIVAASPAQTEERECRPSLSNLWHCPGAEEKQQPTKPVERAERLSLPRRGGAVELNFIEQRQPDSAKN
jgi:hypothetical protein